MCVWCSFRFLCGRKDVKGCVTAVVKDNLRSLRIFCTGCSSFALSRAGIPRCSYQRFSYLLGVLFLKPTALQRVVVLLFWGFPELLPREFSTILMAWAGSGCLASCWNSWILTIQPRVIISKESESHSFLQIFNIYLDAAFVLPLKNLTLLVVFFLAWGTLSLVALGFILCRFLVVFCAVSFWIWCLGPSPSTVLGLGSLPACSTAVLLHQCRVFCHPSLLPWPPPGVGTALMRYQRAQKCNVFLPLLLVLEPELGTRSWSCRESLWAAAFGGKELPQELCCSWQWVEELRGISGGMGQTLWVCLHLCPALLSFAFVVCGVSDANKTLRLTQNNNQRNWTFRD